MMKIICPAETYIFKGIEILQAKLKIFFVLFDSTVYNGLT
jgi:hypothetical protein